MTTCKKSVKESGFGEYVADISKKKRESKAREYIEKVFTKKAIKMANVGQYGMVIKHNILMRRQYLLGNGGVCKLIITAIEGMGFECVHVSSTRLECTFPIEAKAN